AARTAPPPTRPGRALLGPGAPSQQLSLAPAQRAVGESSLCRNSAAAPSAPTPSPMREDSIVTAWGELLSARCSTSGSASGAREGQDGPPITTRCGSCTPIRARSAPPTAVPQPPRGRAAPAPPPPAAPAA